MSLTVTADSVLAMPRMVKRVIVLSVDVSLCLLAVWLSFYLRLGEWVSLFGDAQWHPQRAALVSIALAIPLFVVSGFYRAIFRYSGWLALLTVARVIVIYGLAYAVIFSALGMNGVPRTIGFIQPILLLLGVGASRVFARFWLGGMYQSGLQRAALPGVLIYGAGSSGRQLAAAMAASYEMRVAGFLDDDDRLHRQVLNGLPIHVPDELPELVESLDIHTVLLALPSLSRARRNEIIRRVQSVHVAVRTLPSMSELAQGQVRLSDLRDLDIDDLLGREPVMPDHVLLSRNMAGKVVLVTGAGGSIGSELCRQIVRLDPTALLLVEISEFALYSVHHELEEWLASRAGADISLVPLLASVRDEARMREIMQTWRPETVIHAAAYKHVPLVEHNPVEGLRNNVFGTEVTARIAQELEVRNFVLISTDKAVRPTNVMGASKRLAEMILQGRAANPSGTHFCMVRFGNVLGSSGSVVPRFRQQIRDGGPVTVTHADITRFFMTVQEAAQLVIQAGAMAQGGDVFVLDMGQPVRIIDLARRMIQLSGLEVKDERNPEGDIAIEITGLRHGEKLYEELLIGNNPSPTTHPRILRAQEDCLPLPQLTAELTKLKQALDANDMVAIRTQLECLVSGYRPQGDIVDWVYLSRDAVS